MFSIHILYLNFDFSVWALLFGPKLLYFTELKNLIKSRSENNSIKQK